MCFLSDAFQLTFDPNTASKRLSLTENTARVVYNSFVPDHPERCGPRLQVLCRERLPDRCYWEVDHSINGAFIGVADRDMQRKVGYGNLTDLLGWNIDSWSLRCGRHRSYYAFHNNFFTRVPVWPAGSERVGVYVDQPAGTVSFYRVDLSRQSLWHLHTFHHLPKTRNLLAGLYIFSANSPVTLCAL